MAQVWALHDSDPANNPMQRIRLDQAKEFNKMGFGIFRTVQDFRGSRRIENLARINGWALDLDEGGKESMLERIRVGLTPSIIVETKRGFQPYWLAKDATRENFAEIMNRLVDFYQADPRARDLARILRMPGFYHLKDPSNPFLVTEVWKWQVAYTEQQMAAFYPTARNVVKQEEPRKTKPAAGTFWDRVGSLDCEEALTRLSGHPYVGGETYSFKPNVSGTRNIWVNGKSSSCWIDREGRIGSLDGGGPTIFQWLMWFHKDRARVAEMIAEVFPKCRPY